MSTAFPFNLRSAFGIFYSLVLILASIIQTPNTPKEMQMPVKPNDFTPAVRFTVFSDSHSENDYVAEMIDTAYSLYENDRKYAGIDAICVCGDMTKIGFEGELDEFKATLDEHIRPGTEPFVILGNHELKNKNARDYFEKIFGKAPDQHITVKGFHFIGVANSTERVFTPKTIKWAEAELKKALADTPNLPVFTFQHPHNLGTVYGSTTWQTSVFNRIWESSSQVVNFSGHSHFPMNDPRSIWQGKYTALGCGGMSYFELEKDMVIGQNPEGYHDAAQFYIVEADRDGSVYVRCYDLISDGYFGEEYYIDNVNDATSFAYTYKNRARYDEQPTFAADAKATLTKNENGEYILTLDRAKDKFVIHDYKVRIKAFNTLIVSSKTLLTDYYLIKDEPTITYNLGKLPLVDGVKYTIEITAVNSYYELSEPLVAYYKS